MNIRDQAFDYNLLFEYYYIIQGVWFFKQDRIKKSDSSLYSKDFRILNKIQIFQGLDNEQFNKNNKNIPTKVADQLRCYIYSTHNQRL